MAFNRSFQHLPVPHGERFDGIVEMTVERGGDRVGIAPKTDHRKVELENKVLIMQRRGVLADLQSAKQPLEVRRSRQIVVILQRRQPQAFAKPARAQKQQLFASILNQGNPVGAVDVEIPFLNERGKIGNAIGKAHDDHLRAGAVGKTMKTRGLWRSSGPAPGRPWQGYSALPSVRVPEAGS